MDNTRKYLAWTTYCLTVHCVHASLDLGVNPKCGAILHGAQQESLKVQKNFIVPVSVPRRLVRYDRCKVFISASEKNTNGTINMYFKIKHLFKKAIIYK